jgi:glycerate-2-kinase
MSTTEGVDHPSHYQSGPKDADGSSIYEAIKVIEAWELGFHLGNVVKYISRAGKKTPDIIKDLEKARWYLDRYIEQAKKT